MIQHQTLFSLKFNYNGTAQTTTAVKRSGKHDTLYKIALSSSMSATQQCWLVNRDNDWKVIMGPAEDSALFGELVTAIKVHEKITALTPMGTEPLRRSA